MNDNKDAFDLWWEWAEKPLDSMLTIDAEIHDAVMARRTNGSTAPRSTRQCAMVLNLAHLPQVNPASQDGSLRGRDCSVGTNGINISAIGFG
jgi:hypothetical protein